MTHAPSSVSHGAKGNREEGGKVLSLVIPVYKNAESIPELLAAVERMNAALAGEFEAVFVVDGSPDRSYELLRDGLATCPFSAQLVLLARNFGSFSAIRAGLEVGKGQRFAVMAADLQEPPELVLEMDCALRLGDVDVVIGAREGRADPLLSRLFAHAFWTLYRRYVLPEVPPGGVDVFACNHAFRDELLGLEERHSSLVAQVFWLGFRRRVISYTRLKRKHGKSAWTLRRKVNYLLDSVFSFTDLPIRLLIRVGSVTVLVSLIMGLLVAVLRVLGTVPVPGYAATMLAIIFFGALNLTGIGIVGSYAWRTYENTKARPLHVVLRRHEYHPKPEAP
jgi:polyisoprenyl-phosphate glycosyltransferase